jgi:hypothetical protein
VSTAIEYFCVLPHKLKSTLSATAAPAVKETYKGVNKYGATRLMVNHRPNYIATHIAATHLRVSRACAEFCAPAVVFSIILFFIC